ncbi:lysozyme inhibitor LprI family protein [Anaerobacillus sp. MEB173]|uniref:lysozyme inhibitor LprI family protein n=1 Tax=Anaerobacillus sp. MEB173 TaxID=3383345 RepID=UPI003F8EDFE9
MKKIVCFLIVVILLSGCGNSTYDKAMEEAKLAIASAEFDKGEGFLELALSEKPNDESATVILEQIKRMNTILIDLENGDWEGVIAKANELIQDPSLNSTIKKQVERDLNLAKENKEKESMITERLDTIEKLIDDGNFAEAEVLLTELSQDDSFNTFSKEISQSQQRIEEEKKKKEAEELEAQKIAEAEAKKKAASQKNKYLQKLAEIEKGLSDLDYLYKNGVTIELTEAESKRYERWDDALNEIYGVLKQQMPGSEFEKLRNEQRNWISYRDQKAEEDAAEFEGGTFARVQYLSTLATLTEKRCYELVEGYMK